MTGEINLAVTVSDSDFEILKALEKNCFMTASVKVVGGNMILLDINAFTNANDALK